MKIYLYLPLGGGTMHFKHAYDQIAESSLKIGSPYDTIFNAKNLYINANVCAKQDCGKRLQYDGDRQSFTTYSRIEVAGLTLSKEERNL